MNDQLLWRLLSSPDPAPPDTVAILLEQLAQLPHRTRYPFLPFLEGLLKNEHLPLRRAAIQVLGGAWGLPAWRFLVATLKDPDPEVRRLAVHSLLDSAQADSARWVHALYHPDPLVRQEAENLGVPPGFSQLFPDPDMCLLPEVLIPFPPPGPEYPFPEEDLQRFQSLRSTGSLTAEEFQFLESLLDQGTERQRFVRREIAEYLSSHGHAGPAFPVLLQTGSAEIQYLPSDLLALAARATVMLGGGEIEQWFTDSIYNRSWVDQDQEAVAILLTQANEINTRYWARDQLWKTPEHDRGILRVARVFAWGMEISRFLTGEKFRIEMLLNEYDLGYTRLRENKIYINALPILLEERFGSHVVRGLILHELGHHLYHKGPDAEKIWAQAEGEQLGKLLNLVSDEHLERNLRQRNRGYGHLLKILNAYAFLYSQREIAVASLLSYLGPSAGTVLPQMSLQAARKPGHVRLTGGKLLRLMDAHGHSFARFMRALRLGLGNRWKDPRVEAGLALFRGGFRKSTMEELLEIARKLREIFGSEVNLLQDFGQDALVAPDEAEVLRSGIHQRELDQAVATIAAAKENDGNKKAPGNSWGLNLGPEEQFPLLKKIIPLHHDPVRHSHWAQQVTRPARFLRHYFDNLGLGLKPQRGRLQGRQLDRTQLRDLVLKGDPRILISRRMDRATDLFLGVAIDCSGSMGGTKLDQAKLFGTLLAEALKGNRAVDLRLFGFTDHAIFDAGDARRCAVHDLQATDGNNDAAALWHVYQVGRRSKRKAKLLVMISDGLPTGCSVKALKSLVARLTRQHFCCAQVAVQPLEQVCFPHYVVIENQDLGVAVRRFGEVVMRLVGQALGK